MSDTLATYSFLPWLRQGLANNISQADGDASVQVRASIPVRLTVSATRVNGNAEPDKFVEKDVQLYGPGDIIGIDRKAILKTDPLNWITNFEPNYLPYIDFYEEDFPWRYTPATPNGERLRPWLALVVLKESEFEDGTGNKDKPLPSFKLKEGKPSALFAKPAELWAWAHVHVNTDLSNGALPNTVADSAITTAIDTLIRQNPDRAYSRILCPRKLEANVAYHAFLVPVFESGRLAGLGQEIPPTLMATACAWDDDNHVDFPYYHRWFFRTGAMGDFEYLVNLLKPQPADKTVGVRDMDVLHPGSNLPPINDLALNGILKLGGALRVPFDSMKEPDKQESKKFDEWDEYPYPHTFTKAMARRVNLADDYVDAAKTVADVNEAADITLAVNEGDPDPVITSPLYGRWHGLQQRLLKNKTNLDLPNNKNWVHELNLDPRFRVAAGLGTKVLQKGQEEYMQAAWEQVGKIVEANEKIRKAQLAKEVSVRFHEKHLLALPPQSVFVFTAPVQKRIMYQSLTLHTHTNDSVIPPAMLTGTFRQITRPRGTTFKKIGLTPSINAHNLITRVNEGEVWVAPPKGNPTGGITVNDVTGTIAPQGLPGFVVNALKNYAWFKYLPLLLLLILLLLILLLTTGLLAWGLFAVAAALTVWAFLRLSRLEKKVKVGGALSQEGQTPEAVDEFPTSPDFKLSLPGSGYVATPGVSDSAEAQRFKLALKDAYVLINSKFPEPQRSPLNFDVLVPEIKRALDPAITIPRRTAGTISIPERIYANMVERFAPVMAYPVLDIPMYRPLADMSSELFLPNINRIEPNSITLLENNQKFIEAYMVGINHEMSRELLWREYPTDQRGTFFRQFWDVSSFLPPQPVPVDFKEKLRDIPPIHLWHKTATPAVPLRNQLGQHNQRALASGKTQLVLVIRGELLKKYPTAVIYAQKADWGTKDGIKDGVKDVTEERVFVTLNAAELENPPTSKIKTPLFEAKVEPDIYFLGFDLDDEEARGTLNPTTVTDDPGWFFVIKERPGEPRFGLDIEKAVNESGMERLINWNNLSWKDVGTTDGTCIQLNKTISFQTYDATLDQENTAQPDDVQARWRPSTNAAELAYILYQVPVLVGVHASRMLPS